MTTSFARAFIVLFCVVALFSGCGNQNRAAYLPTKVPEETTTAVIADLGAPTVIADFGAPALGIVTDAYLRVLSIDRRGAAARTTLQQDDIITHWKGEAVTVNTLRENMAATNPTETIEMTVQRGGAAVVILVQLQLTGEANTGSEIPSTPTPVPSNLYFF